MLAERPVAALLSGGVDSSLIASLVAKEMRDAGLLR
jgi:asparagine synthetase B (glutamine-hydrolysing)